MSLETQLRQALKRKNPSSGFDDKVLSRIAAGDAARPQQGGTPWWRRALLPIAASLMLALGATYYLHEQQQHQADEARAQAAREVVMALQVASETLSAAQAKVEEATRYEPANEH